MTKKIATEKVKVHYVGQGVYKAEQFSKEASKHGVSRALPLPFIKKLKFGEKIYVAQWSRTGEKEFTNGKYTELKKIGTAEIFGYFFIEGINIPEEIADYVSDKVRASDPVLTKKKVVRRCGAYMVISSCFTSADLDEICEAIEEAKAEAQDILKVIKESEGYSEEEGSKIFRNLKIKTFLTGSFHALPKPITVKDELFCRTLREMEIPIVSTEQSQTKELQIQGIADYEQITYYPKGDKVVGSK